MTGGIWGHGAGDDPRAIPDADQAAPRDLGPCCACLKGRDRGVYANHVESLPQLAPIPGTGWGCHLCDLPNDGAIAVLCEACRRTRGAVREVCLGYPVDKRRCPVEQLPAGAQLHQAGRHRGDE